MAIEHINRKGKTYYLHNGVTKTGKPKYFFSKFPDENMPDAIPAGYEIYESPNAIVSLRRIQPTLITSEEVDVVRSELALHSGLERCRVECRKDAITIHEPDQDVGALETILYSGMFSLNQLRKDPVEEFLRFSPVMRFLLVDADKRLFIAERWCFHGSREGWIQIGTGDKLKRLASKFIQHIGQESFYELF